MCQKLCPLCEKVKNAFSSRVAVDFTLKYGCDSSYELPRESRVRDGRYKCRMSLLPLRLNSRVVWISQIAPTMRALVSSGPDSSPSSPLVIVGHLHGLGWPETSACRCF
jgi:hypothetical protein